MRNILVTGGAGFIGSNFIHYVHKRYPDWQIYNLDALTYAGNPQTHERFENDPRYTFIHGDITDAAFLKPLFFEHQFEAVFHFAAESHVDRSISGPEVFLNTNIMGTFNLLEASLAHTRNHPESRLSLFMYLQMRFMAVSGLTTHLLLNKPPMIRPVRIQLQRHLLIILPRPFIELTGYRWW